MWIAAEHHVGQHTSRGGRLLEAMAAEPGDAVEAVDAERADDRIVIGRHLVETRPRVCDRGIDKCRQPARRHFGDLGDEQSPVSKLVKERGGYDLLPEMGFKPVNKYLPPRPRRDATTASAGAMGRAEETAAASTGSALEAFFAWADKKLSR